MLLEVEKFYAFDRVYNAGFTPAALDTYSKGELVSAVSDVINSEKPNTIYIPYRLDAHTDHAAVFDAVAACCKSFRYPWVRKVRAYEVLSETGFGLRPEDSGFKPNLYVDVTGFLDKKIEAMKIYNDEIGDHPFPRSEAAIRALATYRGTFAGTMEAEAFISLLEIDK